MEKNKAKKNKIPQGGISIPVNIIKQEAIRQKREKKPEQTRQSATETRQNKPHGLDDMFKGLTGLLDKLSALDGKQMCHYLIFFQSQKGFGNIRVGTNGPIDGDKKLNDIMERVNKVVGEECAIVNIIKLDNL